MSKQDTLEAFEYKGNTFHFKDGLKVEAPDNQFEVYSISRYESYQKEFKKHQARFSLPVWVALVGFMVLFLTSNLQYSGWVLLAVILSFGFFDHTKTGTELEIERLKDYAVKKERKEAYDAWIKSKRDKQEQDEKLKAWMKSNKS